MGWGTWRYVGQLVQDVTVGINPVSYTQLDVYKRQTICFTLYQLLEPFITLWLGAGYILPREIMILIIINLFITVTPVSYTHLE